MNPVKPMLAILLLAAASSSAWADRGRHGHFSVYVGPIWGPPLYAPYPYYYPYPPYYPPIIIERPVPQVYVEQATAPAMPPPAPAAAAPSAPVAAAPSGYWYFCAAANGYYPYVKECPGGWQKVLPQPPGQH